MRSFLPKLIMFIPLLLSACGSVASMTPEMVALRKLTVYKGVDPFSVRILQSQPFQQHVIILAGYRRTNSEGQRMGCNTLFDTYHDRPDTWAASSGHTGCGSLGPFDDQSTSTGSGVSHLAEPGGALFSYHYGLIVNSDVVKINLIWEDGHSQTAPVTNSSYLVVREGEHQYIKVEHFDKTGTIVYTEKP